MKKTPQHRNWISRMRPTAASAVLALAAMLVSAAITTQLAQAQTFTTLHSFDGADGTGPLAPMVQGTDGNFYGTTAGGGIDSSGTVFKITSSGTLTTLYNFCSQSICTDGVGPHALIQATNGNFYGTTGGGGAIGYGTVFKMTPRGALTTLYSFCPQSGCTDGTNPIGALIQATNGNFYGTAGLGGAYASGTVFEITPSGTLTALYSFCSQSNCADGSQPSAGVIQGTDGSFYGTTGGGGAIGYGTVFKITPGGTLTTLYSFCSQSGCADGAKPYAGLVQATNGNFYGTTTSGGANLEGTVFKITPSGTLTTLHSFDETDGSYPDTTMVQGTDGNLYGTTLFGGANVEGTVFKVTPSGTLTTLYSFCSQSGCTDGASPAAGLVQATNGNFYGTTQSGGSPSYGTVFSLSVGLGPFVETRPTSGRVGAAIKILGTNLTGATSVTFNGTAATFTVVSRSEITTTVPAGATSGKVKVVTSSGTLTSNVNFRVKP